MTPSAAATLIDLPEVQFYEAAFRKATGVSLKAVPPDPPSSLQCLGCFGNPFCALAACTPSGAAGCFDAETRALRAAALKRTSQQVYCYAGLTVVAVPVMSGERHLATLLSGQAFRREPTQRDFLLVARLLGDGLGPEWHKKARKAYFATPVITADRFQGVVQLLNLYARYFAVLAERHAFARVAAEPGPVAGAKQFIEQHAEESLTLSRVVEHVHLSRFYFCKLFKKATGMTLTEYVARVRVERAKGLLGNPSLRISEVVFAAGFGSIPRFNDVFKRYVGMPPSEYRASLRL